MIREAFSAVARNESLGAALRRAPIAREIVKRVVAGDSVESALEVAAALADDGFWVSLERAAPSVGSPEEAREVLVEYLALVDRLVASGVARTCEVSVFPDALSPGTPDEATALRDLCESASAAGIPVMVGMGQPDDVDRTIEAVEVLHSEGLLVGVTLQAVLRRTEADCVRFAGRRVRLVKGSHRAEGPAAHHQPIEIDKSYVRCAKTLLRGSGDPSFATHDPRLVEILETLAPRYGRPPGSYEYAFYMGRQEGLQRRLCDGGERVRIYVPYGPDWFERLVGGLAEQPSSIAAAVRSLLPGA